MVCLPSDVRSSDTMGFDMMHTSHIDRYLVCLVGRIGFAGLHVSVVW